MFLVLFSLCGFAIASGSELRVVFTCLNPNLQQAEPAVLELIVKNTTDKPVELPFPLLLGEESAKILWRKTPGTEWRECRPVFERTKEEKRETRMLAPGAEIRGRGVLLATSDPNTMPLLLQEPGQVEVIIALTMARDGQPVTEQAFPVTITASAAESQEAFALWKAALMDPKIVFAPSRLTPEMEPIQALLRDYPDSAYAEWAMYFTAFRDDDPAMDAKHSLTADEELNLDELVRRRGDFPLRDEAAVRLLEHYIQGGYLSNAKEIVDGVPSIMNQASYGAKLVRLRQRFAEAEKAGGK